LKEIAEISPELAAAIASDNGIDFDAPEAVRAQVELWGRDRARAWIHAHPGEARTFLMEAAVNAAEEV
jgi:hypothetical protein